MESKIIKALNDHGLYNDTNIDISKSNKAELFLKTFHPESPKKQGKKFLADAQKDEEGFSILENYPFICLNEDDDSKTVKLLFANGTRASLRTDVTKEEIEKELMVMYFLKSLNVIRVNYEPVSYNGNKFLATPSFLKNSESIINPFTDGNAIEQSYEEAKKYQNELQYLKTVFADRIYGNPSRFPENYGIILDEDIRRRKIPFRNCPLYNNAKTLFCQNDNDGFPHLKSGNSNINEVINYLLNNEGIMHWVINPMTKSNLQAVAERLEVEKGITVSSDTYHEFERFFKDSEKIINEELQNKGKSPCIHFV